MSYAAFYVISRLIVLFSIHLLLIRQAKQRRYPFHDNLTDYSVRQVKDENLIHAIGTLSLLFMFPAFGEAVLGLLTSAMLIVMFLLFAFDYLKKYYLRYQN